MRRAGGGGVVGVGVGGGGGVEGQLPRPNDRWKYNTALSASAYLGGARFSYLYQYKTSYPSSRHLQGLLPPVRLLT